MSDIENKMDDMISILKKRLESMPANMECFSEFMQALHSEETVGASTDTDTARRFQQLSDDTRQDAMIYLKWIILISAKLVGSIQDYFENYEALSFEEWEKMWPDILEKRIKYKMDAEEVVKMHDDMLIQLKAREHEAREVMLEFNRLEEQARARPQQGWAQALACFPLVNAILTQLSNSTPENQGAAALVVQETFIPALSNFIEALGKLLSFLVFIEKELQSFELLPEPQKKLHFLQMRKASEGMKSLCEKFFKVLPNVCDNLKAIPTEGIDQDYDDRWLKEFWKKISKTGEEP